MSRMIHERIRGAAGDPARRAHGASNLLRSCSGSDAATGPRCARRSQCIETRDHGHTSRPDQASDWTAKGPDVFGDELTLGIVLRGGIIIVTVY